MSKTQQTTTELSAKIYNDLLKVFNDASNGFIHALRFSGKSNVPKIELILDHELKTLRNEVIEFRKQFPTFQELKDSGIKFSDAPTYINENGFMKEVVVRTTNSANILECVDILYSIAFVRHVDPSTRKQKLSFKVRGTFKE